MSLVFATLLGTTAAQAEPVKELSLGEMYGHSGGWMGTAHTTPNGMVVLHPLIRSSFGVADDMDVKVSMLGLIGGPNLGIEAAMARQAERFAVSIEPTYSGSWNMRYHQPGATLHASFDVGDRLVIDTSFTARGTVSREVGIDAFDSSLDVLRPEIGAVVKLGQFWAFVVTGRSNIVTWDTPLPTGALGTHFHYGRHIVGASFGLNTVMLGTGNVLADFESESLDTPGIDLPTGVPVPLPHAQIWFRL